MAYDLVLMTQKSVLLSEAQRKDILARFDEETNLYRYCELVNLTAEPDSYDLQDLHEYFQSGELDRNEYEEFCKTRNLPHASGGKGELKAARMFFDWTWGQRLLLLGMPRTDEETSAAYRLIVEFARRHNLVVDDPQAGREVDLENPGEYPPWWHPRYKGIFRPILDWLSRQKP